MRQWIKTNAPDIEATFSRFPLAIILAALGTFLVIALTKNMFTGVYEETLFHLAAGLMFGAVYATAGVLFGESSHKTGPGYFTVAYALPIIAIAIMQINTTNWIVAWMVLPIGLLWLSLCAFISSVSKENNKEIQDKFWWLNHRAITTAIIAGVGFGLIVLGVVAIERAFVLLFGFKTGHIFYDILLPFTGLFLTPVYWLSTLPKLDEFSPADISEPDFLSRAIGFLGQFVLSPFLFAYALILLAYTVQIAFSQSLPQGMLGWMVLGFTIVGAANWLVLHPDFMHERMLVRLFRRYWFWLTIPPIILYVIGVWIRIDAYGLTTDRMGLIAGGLWSGLLTLAFLSKRFADIRLIPGFALVIIVFFSVGPWNFMNGPQMHQAAILDAAIHNARPINQSVGGPYEWTEETGDKARSSIRYLFSFNANSEKLAQVLARHDVQVDSSHFSYTGVFEALDLGVGLPNQRRQTHNIGEPTQFRTIAFPGGYVYDASETPFVIGEVRLRNSSGFRANRYHLRLQEGGIIFNFVQRNEVVLDLRPWLAEQSEEAVTNPVFRFSYEDNDFALVIQSVKMEFEIGDEENADVRAVTGTLFRDKDLGY